jgi:hypothetical protein
MADRLTCPHCGHTLDAATYTGPGNKTPRAGDASVCYYCATVTVFTGTGLERRLPTDAERAEFEGDWKVQRIRQLLLDGDIS